MRQAFLPSLIIQAHCYACQQCHTGQMNKHNSSAVVVLYVKTVHTANASPKLFYMQFSESKIKRVLPSQIPNRTQNSSGRLPFSSCNVNKTGVVQPAFLFIDIFWIVPMGLNLNMGIKFRC